jgi:epoxyqueuosine reductase
MTTVEQKIIGKARELGASSAGIATVAALKEAPSYAAYDLNPFYPEYKGVEWKEEHRSVLVWGLAHPASEPVLDWWSLKVKGFTPGNSELAAQSKRLRIWMNEELGIGALSLPYQIEYGGTFLKDAAVLAGLGIIAENNLLITREFGPRIRLRGMFIEADLEPTGPLSDFDPCAACGKPCHRACPKDAFRGGMYERVRCKQEQDQRDVDFEVLDASITGIDEPSNVTKYCRACELACPVGREKKPIGETAAAVARAAARRHDQTEEVSADQTHFLLPDGSWTAFIGRISRESRTVPALSDAAAKTSPFDAARPPIRLEVLDATHQVAGFGCGDAALDGYLAERALAEQDSGKTRVAVRGDRVIGYFSLRAATVGPPATVERRPGQAPLDVRAVLVTRLAVDASEQGQGLAEAMLVRALARCVQAADTMFARAVLVDAPTVEERGFYERNGFVPSPSDPSHLVMPIEDIRKTLAPPEKEGAS